MMPFIYTWDMLYERADGCGCGDYKLKAKDNARENVRQYILDEKGIDIEDAEIPEEEVEYWCDKLGLMFDEDGRLEADYE